MSEQTPSPPQPQNIDDLARISTAGARAPAGDADSGQRVQLPPSQLVEQTPYDLGRAREETRSDLARIILYLLAFVIGGVLLFIGTGQLAASTLVQSIFPSLVTLAGTALGFYFGAQSAKDDSRGGSSSRNDPPNPSSGGDQNRPSG